jgi:NADPH-dependent curcumin reductase CurA
MPRNQQIVLDNRPQGEAVASNFKLVATDTPALQDGEVLVRHHFLSLDPYMRGRMNESKSYAASQPLGEVMIGGTVGEVAESRNPKFAVGDKVVGMGGWQEYSVVDGNAVGALRKVDTTHVPLSHYLGAVGMPGVTAWYGLVKIIAPKAGDTVVVSAATGAVGSAFAALVFAITVVSIPMILDRDTDAITAAIGSIEVVVTQPGVMLLWGALIVALVTGALLLPWALGLVLVGPLLGHATWHAYRGSVRWL